MVKFSATLSRRAFAAALALPWVSRSIASRAAVAPGEEGCSASSVPVIANLLAGADRPVLIAHNADSAEHIADATAAGADIIEADVWNTGDGLFVAHYLGIAGWVPPAIIAETIFDAIPLETWLATLPAGATPMFDIKDENAATTGLVAEAWADAAPTRSAFLCSPYWQHVEKTASYPNLTGVYTVNRREAFSDVFPLIAATGDRGLSIAKECITPRIVAAAHELGAFVFAWTVNDATQAAYLTSLGVDGLTTDLVADLLPALTDSPPTPSLVGSGSPVAISGCG